MRKINLTPYVAETYGPDGKDAQMPVEPLPLLKAVLFSPQQQLNGLDLYEQAQLWGKLKAAAEAGQPALLEEPEYKRLDDSLNKIKGLGFAQVELVRRIKEAPTVAVQEKQVQ